MARFDAGIASATRTDTGEARERLQRLEEENRRLRELVEALSLDKAMLQEMLARQV